MERARHDDALGGEALDRRPGNVDQLHVRLVVGVEVAGIDAEPLAAEDVVRAEQIGRRRILDDAADLLPREVGDGVVGLLVEQEVAVGAEEGQAAARPELLVLPPALLGRRLQGGLGVERKVEAGRPRPRLGAQRRIVGLHLRHVLRIERRVPGRHRIVGRALEHGQRPGLLGDQGDRLDGRRARADHADLEPGEVDAFLGPFAGVPDRSLEIGHARERRLVGRRQATHRHQAEARLDPITPTSVHFLGLDDPARALLVEGRRRHARGEPDVAAQVEAVGDVVGVGQDLGLRRVLLGPGPFLVELGREGIGILQALHVAARAGIAVPVPGAADPVARLEGDGAEPHLAQAVQGIEPAETGADDDGVDRGGGRRGHAAILPAGRPSARRPARRCSRGDPLPLSSRA